MRNDALDGSDDLSYRQDFEPTILQVLDQKRLKRADPAYRPRTDGDTKAILQAFFATVELGEEYQITNLRRMSGGASKEQFVFDQAAGTDRPPDRYVLRMDPLESIAETSRQREWEVLRAVEGTIPVPHAKWVDADGSMLGQPGLITSFVNGVPKPSDAPSNVTGLGTNLGPRFRGKLAEPFVDYLIKIHRFDWAHAELPSFGVPSADPYQPARWQVNWWSRQWRDDVIESDPMMAAVEHWMRANLPACETLALVHGDYRTGNYLIDENAERITAILDWELAHIGDPIEDLGWVTMRPLGHESEDGRFLVCGLFTREEFLALYERKTGTTVDRKKLHFYEVLALYKCVVFAAACGMRSAIQEHNHQNVLLTWVAHVAHAYRAELCELLARGPTE